MVKKLCMIGLVAAMAAAPAAFAGSMPAGALAGYVTMSELDIEGLGNDDGTGFGLRGWASLNGPWFVHGEYQTTSLDDADIDLESLRLGGGFAGEIQTGTMWLVKGEYIDLGSDADEDGFGVHGGVMFQASEAFGLFGTLGYLTLNDTDGLELNVGAKVAFTKELAGVLDYRTYMGEYDVGGATGDFTVDDLRFGVAYMFY
jgi:hypothetical protein